MCVVAAEFLDSNALRNVLQLHKTDKAAKC